MTRWLDEHEQVAWQLLVRLTLELPYQLDAQLQRDAGITHFDYGILAKLSDGDGPTQLSSLAQQLHCSQSRLSHAMRRLETQGLVRRFPRADDGRVTMAELTSSGRSFLRRAAPGHVEEVRRLVFDRLSQRQVSQLEAICTALARDRR